MADLHVTLASGTEVALSNAGTPFAQHVVVLCNPQGVAGFLDPDPAVTARHPVHLVVVDPVSAGDQPAALSPAQHAATIAEYLVGLARIGHDSGGVEPGRVGVIGWGSGALVATALALDHAELIGAVALVAPDLAAESRPALDEAAAARIGDVELQARTERAIAHDREPQSASVTRDGADDLAARWAKGPGAGPDVLTVGASTTDASAGDAARPDALQTLATHWDAVLRHVEQSPEA